MPKAKKDFIKPETVRKIKNMSVAELTNYLYAIYLKGYAHGSSDRMTRVLHPGETRGQ